MAVTVLTEDERTDRPHYEPDPEHRERQQQGDQRRLVWKKQLRDDRDEIAIDREVVPLQHVADHPGEDCGSSLAGRLADGWRKSRHEYSFFSVQLSGRRVAPAPPRSNFHTIA